jgi:hypothetical protein
MKEEVKRILDLKWRERFGEFAEVGVGYIHDFSPLENYFEFNLYCPYEHCIECMECAESGPDENSCPVFGHNCPGGIDQEEQCKTLGRCMEDFFSNRPKRKEQWEKLKLTS